MKLRELKYNVFFEYIKDIRRYNYDIEINNGKRAERYGYKKSYRFF